MNKFKILASVVFTLFIVNTAFAAKSFDKFYQDAIKYYKNDNFNKAIECIDCALNIKPNDYHSNCFASILYDHKNDKEKTYLYFSKAISINTNKDSAFGIAGDFYFNQQDYQLASKYYLKAIILSKNDKEQQQYYLDQYKNTKQCDINKYLQKWSINYIVPSPSVSSIYLSKKTTQKNSKKLNKKTQKIDTLISEYKTSPNFSNDLKKNLKEFRKKQNFKLYSLDKSCAKFSFLNEKNENCVCLFCKEKNGISRYFYLTSQNLNNSKKLNNIFSFLDKKVF